MEIKVRVQDKDTVRYIRQLPESINRKIIEGVRVASNRLTYYVKGKYLNRHSNESIGRVSSEIFRSTIPIKTRMMNEDMVVGGTEIGSSSSANKYLHVHVSPRPKTTVIFPKKGKYLAIPLSSALATFGVRRISPRDLPSSEFRGNVLGSNISGGFVPFFVMKRSVSIRSRVHTKKIANEFKPVITKTIDDNIRAGLK